jgi:hypothetical protein
MRALDFSSWQGLLSTLLGLAVFSLVVVGIRLLVMQVVQLRRERENRQINERLRTLIAAYKTLGGSFTGNLQVDPTHRRERRAAADAHAGTAAGAERRRRVRDAVEAALSDVILLGTEEQVRLAAQAARDMAAGRAVDVGDLVVSLRHFIRAVLDLERVPDSVVIPRQGPARPGGARNRDEGGGSRGGGERAGAGRGSGGGGGAGGATGGGMGTGLPFDAHDDAVGGTHG